jgi:AcrR family transcriptional regulator
MSQTISQAETNRKTGKFQVDEQHERILDAAEKLFLLRGIENTNIGDIAAQANITRVTLYRYFANKDEIAVKIQARMFKKIHDLFPPEEQPDSLESHRRRAQTIIRGFNQLRDAYRYIGMFDQIYLDQSSQNDLPRWTLAQLRADHQEHLPEEEIPRQPSHYHNQLTVISSNVTWFLEKLALRGEITWSDQETPLEQHLQIFEDIIMGYFDRLIAEEAQHSAK